jgi:hypothetical protein
VQLQRRRFAIAISGEILDNSANIGYDGLALGSPGLLREILPNLPSAIAFGLYLPMFFNLLKLPQPLLTVIKVLQCNILGCTRCLLSGNEIWRFWWCNWHIYKEVGSHHTGGFRPSRLQQSFSNHLSHHLSIPPPLTLHPSSVRVKKIATIKKRIIRTSLFFFFPLP